MKDFQSNRRVVMVMPSFNSAKHLATAINSFLIQKYPKKKLVIIDGKSTDNSHNILTQYSTLYPEVVWINEQDDGISSGLNIAMKYVDEADIWGYLGADDIILPDVLEKVASLFVCIPNLEGAYFDSYTHVPGRAPILRQCPKASFSLVTLNRFGTIAGLQNFFIDGSLVKRFGFNEKSRYSMDYELYLRLAHNGYVNFIHVPEPSTVNIADKNITSLYAEDGNLEALQFARKIGGHSPILMRRYILHVMKAVRRRMMRLIGAGKYI